jgi:hypothetical protein
MRTVAAVFGGAALALGGCAASMDWQTEKADPGFVDGTRILAQAAVLYTRDQILAGKREVNSQTDRIPERWREKLLSVGFSDADIVDGSELGSQTYCYAFDTVITCRHRGIYLAHVDPSLQGKINLQTRWTRGDIVEIELRKTPSNDLVGVVVATYRKFDSWQDCRMEDLGDMGILKYSPYGPWNAGWLECDGLEERGWSPRIVRSAPYSDPNKPPVRHVREWIKLPPGSRKN